jgi:hypothetical protein
MELKLIEIQRAQQAFQKIMNTDLPAKTAFRLSRIAKIVDEIYIQIEATRNKLVQKYGAPAGKTGNIIVKPENVATFQQEFSELLSDETIELDVKPIKLEVLEEIKLTALDMLALEPFVKE